MSTMASACSPPPTSSVLPVQTPPRLLIVVPCYNEASILDDSLDQLLAKLKALTASGWVAADSAVLCVDDGSRDATWDIISRRHEAAPGQVLGIKLAANCGHQKALLAGLRLAADMADCAVSIDADLQDDLAVIDGFLEQYWQGAEIVYGVRTDRSSDTAFKRLTAEAFYHLMSALGVKIFFNHSYCRLMSRRALQALFEYSEVNLFLRGIVPLIGLRQATVGYARRPTSRQTHYPLRKMLMLAWDGITSFSIRPIRMITVLGFVIFFANIILGLRYLVLHYLGYTIQGWTSLALLVLALGGLQLLGIGLIGEYIGKTYLEVKRRPRFLYEKVLGAEDKQAPDAASRPNANPGA